MVTLLCCCLLSSAWALVSLRGPGAPPVPLLALNVVPPARSGLGVLPTHVPLCRAAGQEGGASPLSPLLLKAFQQPWRHCSVMAFPFLGHIEGRVQCLGGVGGTERAVYEQCRRGWRHVARAELGTASESPTARSPSC